MKDKLKLWDAHPSWDAAERQWDQTQEKLRLEAPLKQLSHLPTMPGITSQTKRALKWKSLNYLIKHDKKRVLPRYFFKSPLRYLVNFLKSAVKKKSYSRDGDFFLYGLGSIDHFKSLLEDSDSLLVVGFSYCHKPFECPSGRFTDTCRHELDHPICRQCFIGKAVHALPNDAVIPLFIPTIHYIGEKIFEIVHKHSDKKILFIITACELTLEMFGDWGNMTGIRGIGVRLDGRICNTMDAFILSEEGIKPGLTVVLDETQKRLLDLIRHRRER
ncbi:MAG: hypothetical protein ACM3JI_05285 [Anaerolineae bacterium]